MPRASLRSSNEACREHQADLPAEPARAQAPPRLPRAHVDHGRKKGAGPPPRQGPQAPQRLIQTLVRLTKRSQFLFIRGGSKTIRESVIVEARRRALTGAIGIGLTASKKVGNAVIRNRARRRLREAARSLLPALGVAGVDYVLVARQTTAAIPWPRLLDDLQNALIRLAPDLEDRTGAPRRAKRSKSQPPPSD